MTGWRRRHSNNRHDRDTDTADSGDRRPVNQPVNQPNNTVNGVPAGPRDTADVAHRFNDTRQDERKRERSLSPRGTNKKNKRYKDGGFRQHNDAQSAPNDDKFPPRNRIQISLKASESVDKEPRNLPWRRGRDDENGPDTSIRSQSVERPSGPAQDRPPRPSGPAQDRPPRPSGPAQDRPRPAGNQNRDNQDRNQNRDNQNRNQDRNNQNRNQDRNNQNRNNQNRNNQNRDYQNRNSQNRDNYRNGQNRDNQNRNNQNRDNLNRNQNRDNQNRNQNRDNQNRNQNRDPPNRSDRPENRNRDDDDTRSQHSQEDGQRGPTRDKHFDNDRRDQGRYGERGKRGKRGAEFRRGDGNRDPRYRDHRDDKANEGRHKDDHDLPSRREGDLGERIDRTDRFKGQNRRDEDISSANSHGEDSRGDEHKRQGPQDEELQPEQTPGPLPPPPPPPLTPPPPPNMDSDADSGPAQRSSASPGKVAREVTPMPTMRAESVYRRLIQVGEGTYGRVYKSENLDSGNIVALKRLRMEAEREGMPITAIREIKLLQSLRHVNVVSLREMMIEQNSIYMIFEYMDHDLAGILGHPVLKLSPANIKYLFKQMLDGLSYLHHKGIVHRDIKGSNILIDTEFNLKLADFGLARKIDLSNPKAHYTNRVITLWYRPPELLLGATIYSCGIDVWGMGCLLLEMFTQSAMFPGQDEISQLDAIYKVLGTPTAERWPSISELPWYQMLLPYHTVPRPNIVRSKYEGIPGVTEQCFDLAEKLLTYDPKMRLSADDALSHAYFLEEPAPEKLSLDDIGEWHDFEAKRRRRKEREERKRRESEEEKVKREVEAAEARERAKVH